MSAAYSIGVLPWRRTISWNSSLDWEMWVVSGRALSCAWAAASRSVASVQVSIWPG